MKKAWYWILSFLSCYVFIISLLLELWCLFTADNIEDVSVIISHAPAVIHWERIFSLIPSWVVEFFPLLLKNFGCVEKCCRCLLVSEKEINWTGLNISKSKYLNTFYTWARGYEEWMNRWMVCYTEAQYQISLIYCKWWLNSFMIWGDRCLI